MMCLGVDQLDPRGRDVAKLQGQTEAWTLRVHSPYIISFPWFLRPHGKNTTSESYQPCVLSVGTCETKD